MNDWFRAYHASKDDPKLLLLPSDTLRWQWFVLLCVAAQHEGEIPSLEIAALGLRLPPAKAARVIAALHRAELMDETKGGYFHPHNWSGRQYKSDQDPTRNERQQRHRENKRNALRNGPSNAGVTREVTRTDTDTDTDTEIGGGGDAREPVAKAPWELEPSHDLARQLAEIAKASDEFEGTGWGGATYRVKTWLSEGWTAEFILAAFRETCGKSGYLPPNGIKYFEKIVARFIALQREPLPTVVEIPAKTVEVSHGSANNSASAAARRLEQSIQQQLAESGLDNEPYQPTYLRIQAG